MIVQFESDWRPGLSRITGENMCLSLDMADTTKSGIGLGLVTSPKFR